MVQPGDNLGVAQVDLILDGKTLASLTEPPYAFPWQATAGEHTLRVVVTDRAGNTAEETLEFSVSP